MSVSDVAIARLSALAKDWIVDLRGHMGQWVLRLQSAGNGEFYLYRGDNLSSVLARAWAGEPSDRHGPYPWED